MQFSAGQNVRLKNYGAQTFFPLMIFKHGLLEGLIFLFKYSSISRTKLESFGLGELKIYNFSRIGHTTGK